MKIAFLFPGQGAQHVGMGADIYRVFPVARDLFDQAEGITRLPLKKLCFEGPQDQLARTDVSQPAIFTASMAALGVLKELMGDEKFPTPDCCAGLSLGEYTALCAGGAISFADGVKLVAERGKYMQAAATATPSGMVCLLGADEALAEKICNAARGDGVLVPANFNCPGQIVLSGTEAACRKAEAIAVDYGAGGVVPLEVAGAFHSPLMALAAEKLAEILKQVTINPPAVAVFSNVTAAGHGDPDEIRRDLVAQLTNPVLWQRCCEAMKRRGIEQYLEIGPGRVLAGLMRRIDRAGRVKCLNTRLALEEYAGSEAAAFVEKSD
ncbi:MAG: ACP S-malonyltransferase [Planctomycetes bacterium]|nr:ACP S-malonyltransferase [Planctomycetota bacterium]